MSPRTKPEAAPADPAGGPPLNLQIAFRLSTQDALDFAECASRADMKMHTWMRKKLRQAVADARRKR